MTACAASTDQPADGSDIRRTFARATFWAAVETVGAQGAAFVFFVVFARLVSPAEFGVYALGMAIVGTVNMVLFQGFADGLIQAERLDDEATSTAFWTNMMLATAMVGGLQALAWFAPALFHEPALGPVLAWLALLCLPRGLVSVHSALFRRTLDLRIFAIRTILGSVVGSLVGLGLAVAGFGVWALVVSQLVQSVLVAAIMWRSTTWRPRLLFSAAAFRQLLDFSRHFMAASVITSCIDDFGSVLIGLTMDVVAVGTYAVALRVVRAVILLLMTPLQLVMMPALSRLVRDRARFVAAYSDMVLTISLVWFPVMAGLGLAAAELVPLVFGPKWAAAAEVVQAMSFVALTMPLWAFSGQALSALGRPDAFARLAYAQLGLYCVLFPVAARFGIVAVGWTWALLSAAMVPVSLHFLRARCGLDVRLLLARNMRIVASGVAMVAVVLLVRSIEPTGLGLGQLVLAGAAGTAVYAACVTGLLPDHVARLFGIARGAMAPAGGVR